MEIIRLNNPQNLNRDLTSLDIVTINNIKYRTFTQISKHVYSGSCQCFKDCNCSDKKGQVKIIKTTWYRKLIHDNTNKCFYNIPHNK